MISVVGMGPGGREYVIPEVWDRARRADVLVGGVRARELFAGLDKEFIELTGDMDAVLDRLESEARARNVVVMVSGDPGLFSLLGRLRERFGDELEVVPGISSVQLAFARIKRPWEDVAVASLHGRPLESAASLVESHRKVCLFLDPAVPAPQVAGYLCDQGVTARSVVWEALSYPEESVLQASLSEVAALPADRPPRGLSLMYVEREL